MTKGLTIFVARWAVASLPISMVFTFSCVREAWVTSVANRNLSKELSIAGPDQNLLYPLGVCSGQTITRNLSMARGADKGSPYLRGLVALRNSDLNQAERMFELSTKGHARSLSGLYASGVTKVLQGNDPLPIWRKGNSTARLLIAGGVCVSVGNVERAENYYRNALLITKSTDLDGFRQLLMYFAGTKDEAAFAQALSGYLQTADPESLEFHWTLGEVFLLHREPDRALRHFDAVLSRDSNNPRVWYARGRVFAAMNRFEEARAELDKAIRLAPQEPDPYVFKGHTFLYQERYSEAADWCRNALAIDPENDWAMTTLARVRINQARNAEALELAVRAMKRNSRAHPLFLASLAAAKLGQWDLSRKYVLSALAKDPSSLQYLEQLADICEATGDLDGLRKTCVDILRLNSQDIHARQRLKKIGAPGF